MSRTATWVSADRSTIMEQPEKILFFDGVCNLCNGLVKFVIRHDHNAAIRFAPLQSQGAADLLCRNNITGSDSVIYLTEGGFFIKSSAILRMFRDMGGAWRLLYGFIIVPRFIRDFIYDVVARNRYRIFGRRESCMVPTPDVKERFLLKDMDIS